jgi:chromosomal replication initiator protein
VPIQLQTKPDPKPTHPNARKQTETSKSSSRDVSDALAKRIGAHKYDMWFAHTDMRIVGERLEVATGSPVVAKWIDAHFADELHGAAEQTLGRPMQVQVRVANRASSGAGAETAGSARPVAPHEPNGRRQPDPAPGSDRPSSRGTPRHRTPNRHAASLRRLDDFVVGPSNKLAFATACRLAEDSTAKCVSPLFIHGECGVGKTHLLQGVCQRYIERSGRSQQVRYVTGEQFTNEYIASIRGNSIDAFRQRIRKLDLLAIDDVHFLSNKVRTQTEFLYTIDAIDLSGARVVMASDNHPHHIKRYSQALVSRFLSGMVVKVDRPDRSTRIELIHRLASARGVRLSQAAVEVIAANCVGSVREIEGALTKLAAYQFLLERPQSNGQPTGNPNEIGVVLAEQVFKDNASQTAQIVKVPAVIEAVCTRIGVTRADLLGSGRHRRVVLARALVAYLGREMTTRSFPEIAQALGRSNHSTIHTADQRLRKQLANNESVDLGDDGPISLKELSDQLRGDVIKAGAARLES